VKEQIRPNVMHVVLVPNQKKAVRNVPSVTLVKQELDSMVLVINVLRVNTVRAVWNRLRAMHAPLVLVKVTKDKLRVQNAARANSMTLLTRRRANNVQSQRILVAKEETVVALIVQLVGGPKSKVQNASHVKPVCLATVLVKTARSVMLANTVKVKKKMVTSLIQRLVLVVQLVSFLWKKEVRNASRVVRVRLAMGVKIAPKGMQEQEPTVMLPNANNVH
jgi:hypothetical protein